MDVFIANVTKWNFIPVSKTVCSSSGSHGTRYTQTAGHVFTFETHCMKISVELYGYMLWKVMHIYTFNSFYWKLKMI